MDGSDIPVDLVKICLYLKFEIITLIMLVIVIVTWFFVRFLLLFSLAPAGLDTFFVYANGLELNPYVIPEMPWFGLLYCCVLLLILMNTYWFVLFLRIFKNIVTYL